MGRVHLISDLTLNFLDPPVTPHVSSNFILTLSVKVHTPNKIRQR